MTKPELWQQRIDQWKASGLSQKQFCKDNDLKFYTFQYWVRKLCTSSDVASKSSAEFIPVNVQPQSLTQIQIGACTIQLPASEAAAFLVQLNEQGLLHAQAQR